MNRARSGPVLIPDKVNRVTFRDLLKETTTTFNLESVT
jgi:hypothetical protein